MGGFDFEFEMFIDRIIFLSGYPIVIARGGSLVRSNVHCTAGLQSLHNL